MGEATTKSAIILASSVLAGDAVGRHICSVMRVLQEAGYRVELWYDGAFTRSEADIRAISVAVDAGVGDPKADVVILEYAGWFPLAEKIRQAKGTRIFWYHGVTPPDLWGSDFDREMLEISIFGSRLVWACNLAATCSPFGAAELSRHTGFPSELTITVPIGVDAAEFERSVPQEQLAALRKKLHLENRQTILYVGRLAGNKRIDLLVQALFLLRDRWPELHLVIVGDDRSSAAYSDCAQGIRNQASELGLGNRVTLTGKVPDVHPYYQLADVFAIASEHEGFGVPLVEAMAARVPVVASNAAAIPWVMGADEGPQAIAGILFESGSAEALAEAIASILSQPGYAHELAQRGLRRAQQFGPERFRADTLAMIDIAQREARERPIPALESVVSLAKYADVALRQYRVRSRVPIVGKLIEWLRVNMTSHLKEAYVDRVVERQIMYNRMLLDLVRDMQLQLHRDGERIDSLSAEVARLKKRAFSDDVS